MSGYEKPVSVSVLSQLGVEAVESALCSLSLRCPHGPRSFHHGLLFYVKMGSLGSLLLCCVFLNAGHSRPWCAALCILGWWS